VTGNASTCAKKLRRRIESISSSACEPFAPGRRITTATDTSSYGSLSQTEYEKNVSATSP